MDTYPDDFHEYENESPFFPEDLDLYEPQASVAVEQPDDIDLRPSSSSKRETKKSVKQTS